MLKKLAQSFLAVSIVGAMMPHIVGALHAEEQGCNVKCGKTSCIIYKDGTVICTGENCTITCAT